MPRTVQNIENATLPEPVDIIDLTQDSPHNTAFQLSRIESERNQDQTQNDSVVIKVRISENNINKGSLARRKKSNNCGVVINLEDTITLDDSVNNSNTPKQAPTVSPGTQNSTRPALTCPICLDSLSGDNLKAMTTPCGHIYCLDCLKTITNSKETCSICKRAIKFSKCIRLHI